MPELTPRIETGDTGFLRFGAAILKILAPTVLTAPGDLGNPRMEKIIRGAAMMEGTSLPFFLSGRPEVGGLVYGLAKISALIAESTARHRARSGKPQNKLL